MISRRSFIGSGVCAGLASIAPGVTLASEPAQLIVRPDLLDRAAPNGAITLSGTALLRHLLPFEERWSLLEGITDNADAALLRELIRVRPGALWCSEHLPAHSWTVFGCTVRPALSFTARWG